MSNPLPSTFNLNLRYLLVFRRNASRGLSILVFLLLGFASPLSLASVSEMIPLLEHIIKLQSNVLAKPDAVTTRIEPGPALKIGSSGIRILKLNTRLTELGLMTGPLDELFGVETELAVCAFQEKVGLVIDGVVDHQTRFNLNLSDQDKVDILRLQIEEMESFYKENEDQRYIIVNIPGYTLRAYEGNKKILESRVVVGGAGRKTPLMKTNLIGVVFNPTWSPPKTILAKDIFRSGQIQSKAVSRMGLRLLDAQGKAVSMKEVSISTQEDFKNGGYRFMQPSGAKNALGLLKFDLDNRFDIYMHDTNHRELFERQSRAFSSGCIRVERFRELASWVTEKPLDELDKALQSRRTHRLEVEKLPVHIVYWTVDASQGKLVFNRDIYSRVRLSKKPVSDVASVKNQ